jgi:hypothetical protein
VPSRRQKLVKLERINISFLEKFRQQAHDAPKQEKESTKNGNN